MPSITAILHTRNDAVRLGRALETLYACDEILVVDHASSDGTIRVARNYGTRVIDGKSFSLEGHRAELSSGWLLCLDPNESLSEGLAASLFELKSALIADRAFSVSIREETSAGWAELRVPQTRLVPGKWNHWHGALPVHDPAAERLQGELLRFSFP